MESAIDKFNREWDEQIAADSEAGFFSAWIAEIEEEIASGQTRSTDEL